MEEYHTLRKQNTSARKVAAFLAQKYQVSERVIFKWLKAEKAVLFYSPVHKSPARPRPVHAGQPGKAISLLRQQRIFNRLLEMEEQGFSRCTSVRQLSTEFQVSTRRIWTIATVGPVTPKKTKSRPRRTEPHTPPAPVSRRSLPFSVGSVTPQDAPRSSSAPPSSSLVAEAAASEAGLSQATSSASAPSRLKKRRLLLTKVEKEIALRMRAHGINPLTIASCLDCSPSTVS